MAAQPICLPGEIWKPVIHPRFCEPIEVSSMGRVRRARRTYMVQGREGVLPFLVTRPLRIAKPILRRGYPSVSVKDANGKKPFIAIHILACLAFVGPQPSDEYEVAHWDGDPLNPAPSNLRWATPLENAEDRERHERTCKGEDQRAAVLTEDVVRDLRQLWREGPYPGHTALAVQYDCHRSTITRAVLGERWKHVG